MRRLMLLRHAKTEHDSPSGHDEDRRLDERGRLDAAAIGTWIGRHPPFPDTVLVSTAVRARQTWEIARDAMTDAVRDRPPQPQVESTFGLLVGAMAIETIGSQDRANVRFKIDCCARLHVRSIVRARRANAQRND